MKIFVRNFNPQIDGTNGSFASIKKRTNNLKKYFEITNNDNRTISYEKLIGIGRYSYQGYLANGKANITFSFKRHLMQITDFVVGEPKSICYSHEFNLIGRDEKGKEVFLGSYNNLEYNFCSSISEKNNLCQHNESVVFKVVNESKLLLKSITYAATRGSCATPGHHLAMKGIDFFGNLYEINNYLTCICRKARSLNHIVLICLILS